MGLKYLGALLRQEYKMEYLPRICLGPETVQSRLAVMVQRTCSLEKVRNGPANNIGEIKILPGAIGRSVHASTLANQVT